MSRSKAQDPNEAFDVVTADGVPTGVVKSRSAVHREGDWHRSIHVWIAGTNESGPYLIFQRRSPAKDTWGGKFDATVGGHFRAGETLTETMREVEEEIGIRVAEIDLLPLGVRVCVTESAEARDNELQSVFLWLTDRPLLTFAPNPDELASLNQFRIADLFALFEGEVERIDSLAKRPGADPLDVETVALDDFIPNIDRYFYRVAITAERALNGERRLAI
jgi:isopentenyldiphosphate isomerase